MHTQKKKKKTEKLLPLKINKPGVYSLSGRVLAYHM
jgi:hypothetical protein